MQAPERSLRLSLLAVALAALAAPIASAPAQALEFHVDAAIGDDSRAPIDAQSPETPWATIQRALRTVTGGSAVVVHPGRYSEALETRFDGVSLRAADGLGTVVVAPPAGQSGLVVAHRGIAVSGILFAGGVHGIRAEVADGLRVFGCVAVGQASNGFTVLDSTDVVIDSSRAVSAAGRGIHLVRSGDVLLRNDLIYGNGTWGIDFDEGSADATRTIAFTTVAYNGGAAGGGVRLGAPAEVHDSAIAFNAPVGLRVQTSGALIHHSDLFGDPTLLPDTQPLGAGTISLDPQFRAPSGLDGVLGGIAGLADDDFALLQLDGEQPASPLVDAGSGLASERDIDGSTAGDGRSDAGRADIGFHGGASPSRGMPSPAVPDAGAVYHVDCAQGDDSRSKLAALDPATPWRSLGHAALVLGEGETALVHAGVCAEGVETRLPRVSFVTDEPGSVVLEPPAGTAGFNVQHDGVLIEGFVIHSSQQGVLAAKSKAGDVLRDLALRNLVVEPPAGGTLATNGIQVRDAEGVTIENSVVRGAAQIGILLKRVSHAYVRNNLVYGQVNDWGISIDGDSPDRYAASVDDVVAFNTVSGNLRGLRLRNTFGEVRDNVMSENAQTGIKYDVADAAAAVHHNDVWRSPTAYDLPSGIRKPASNLEVDPQLLDPAGGRFELKQAAGEAPPSPVLDAGSGPVGDRDIDGSTASDGRPDTGRADLGFHAGAAPTRGLPAGAAPDTSPVYHVDCAQGDDSRTKLAALDPATPWRTLKHAALVLVEGEIALVHTGVCAEGVETRVARVGFVAAEAGGVALEPPAGTTGVNVQHDGVLVDGFVIHSGLQGVLAAKSKAGEILRDLALRNLVVEPPVGGSLATNGIQVRDAEGVTVENSVVRGAGQVGLLLKRVSHAYVRNNLVYGQANDWGISIDGDSPDRYAASVDDVAAFNTVWGNLRGLRLRNSFGEVRDNVVSQNAQTGIKYDQVDAAVAVHHNDAWGSTTPYDLPSGVRPAASNLQIDPQLLDPAGGRFELRQAPGEAPVSPALDAGSGLVSERDIGGSTASDGRPDTGLADLGFHADADGSVAKPLTVLPTPGTPRPLPTATPVPTPTPTPAPGSGSRYHVDPLSGDDARSPAQARSAGGAWRTLGRALNAARPGDVVLLHAGLYREQADWKTDGVTLRGDGTLGSAVIAPPAGKAGIYAVDVANARVENLVVDGAAQGIVARNAPGFRATGVAVVSSGSNGIVLENSPAAWVDGSIVTGSGAMGIKAVISAGVYLRNNLVYANADWGISIDHTQSGVTLEPSIGNVVAFNTVHANRSGIRLLNASGEVRDNNVTGQTDLGFYLAAPNVTLHHNNFASNRRDRDSKGTYLDSFAAWANVGANPRYMEPAGDDGILGGAGWRDDDFRLQRIAAGDAFDSPSRDAGSAPAGELDIDGSTSRDGAPDLGNADVGFHPGASPATRVPAPMPIGQNLQQTYYVDASAGDDTRTPATARRPETPWRTIQRALAKVAQGDTIVVRSGVYATATKLSVAGVRLVADVPGEVFLRAPGAVAIGVEAPGVVIDGFVIDSAATGVSVLAGGSGAVVRNCAIVATGSDGIRAVDVTDVTVDGSVVASAGGSGIRLKRVARATVRNSLLYDSVEWGVSSDADGIATSAVEIVSNTVFGNRTGGVQLRGVRGLVRDNLVTDSGGVGLKLDGQALTVVSNGFARNKTAMDPSDYLARCATCTGNRTLDPRYARPAGADGLLGRAGWADDDFRLSEGAGGAPASGAIDVGSGLAADLGANGTTAPSGLPDVGRIDLGFHYRADPRALDLPRAATP